MVGLGCDEVRTINKAAMRVTGRLLSNRRVGSYFHLVIEAPNIAQHSRPGNFVAIAVGGMHSSMILHRVFAIYRSRSHGAQGSIIELILAESGKGSQWLINQNEGTELEITGPLGNSFPLPAEPLNVALVGGGYGAAPLFDLAEHLKGRGCRVHAVIGAATSSRVFAPLDGKRAVNSVTVTTEDGSAGVQGLVTEPLPDLIEREKIDLIYSCGPMAMLKAVDEVARRFDISHQLSVEEAMACGIGICMTCVLPMRRLGSVSMVRSCIEGPVIDSDDIAWDQIEAWKQDR
jgi:dihydroorotate dehydrogenase electron transfer subunit